MQADSRLDHIVVAASTLEAGLAWTEERLGVVLPQAGGKHPLMGTHNRVMRLGEASFLEVIAPDLAAPDPGRVRWFGLDSPPDVPRLAHWLVRVPGLVTRRDALPLTCGPALAQQRGDLRWKITVPEDGHLPFGGVFPSFLDWECDESAIPPRAMPGGDLTLTALQLSHPRAAQAEDLLAPILQDERVHWTVSDTPALTARLTGPSGEVVLS